MQNLDPMSYNAIRFTLGALFIWLIAARKSHAKQSFPWLLGIVLFVAASLQQIGVLYTTAGSAGFITGLYVVMVPVFGLFRGHKPKPLTIIAILLAVCGMLLINNPKNIQMSYGNLLVLISAVFWAWHVQLVDIYSHKSDTGFLAFAQFSICAILSAIGAVIVSLFSKSISLFSADFGSSVLKAGLPILYGGILSVGIAYSLQIKAQRNAIPAKAAVILCLEGVFALFGGWLILGEALSLKMLAGAGLMLLAMLLSLSSKLFD